MHNSKYKNARVSHGECNIRLGTPFLVSAKALTQKHAPKRKNGFWDLFHQHIQSYHFSSHFLFVT